MRGTEHSIAETGLDAREMPVVGVLRDRTAGYSGFLPLSVMKR